VKTYLFCGMECQQPFLRIVLNNLDNGREELVEVADSDVAWKVINEMASRR
jgi:hypothetical protein